MSCSGTEPQLSTDFQPNPGRRLDAVMKGTNPWE